MRLVLAHLAQILIAALGGLIFHWLGVVLFQAMAARRA